MKQVTKRFLACLLALAMVLPLGVASRAQAAEVAITVESANVEGAAQTDTQDVTLHKILMPQAEFDAFTAGTEGKDGTTYDGNKIGDVSAYFGGASQEIAGAYFVWKFADGAHKGAYVGLKGEQIVAVTLKADNAKTTLGTNPKQELAALQREGIQLLGAETQAEGHTFDVSKLPAGKYEIDEIRSMSNYNADGKVLADAKAVPVEITLPLVNDQGAVANAHVYPKNTDDKPHTDKDFAAGFTDVDGNDAGSTGSLVDANTNGDRNEETTQVAPTPVGPNTIVPYEVSTQIPAHSHYKTMVWEDTMTQGLTFLPDTLEIKLGESKATAAPLEAGDYTIKANASGFRLELTEAGLKKVENPAQNLVIVITYSAQVNEFAIVETPDKNDVRFRYSNKPNQFQEEEPKEVEPKKGKITVNKTTTGGAQIGETLVFDLYLKGDAPDGSQDRVVATKSVTIDASNQNNFQITFDKLEDGKYYVKERASQYVVTQESTEAGQVALTNTKDNDNPPPLNPEEPSVVLYGKKFVKTEQGTDTRLAGAQFVVKNQEGKFLAYKGQNEQDANVTAIKTKKDAYIAALKQLEDEQKKPKEEQTQLETLQAQVREAKEAYFAAVKEAANVYTWVEAADAMTAGKMENVVVLFSDEQGRFEISGLKLGTYTLVEIKAPEGYANSTAGNEFQFQVTETSYNNDPQGIKYDPVESAQKDATRVDNRKTSIPQTGGMGTIIFTVAGLALMAGAVFAMKRRNAEEA